ncbi:MAG: serine/threonine protein kinase [Candidatus Obscuribacterales bacterium]|nr:serine/threonine protein kinase [Candidatus Obscuribacterales bacterium]
MKPDEFFSQENIVDRYQYEKTLGEGGLGVVFAAHDKHLDRLVAIKILKSAIGDEQAVRFQREAKATARLRHRNILQVHDFGVTGASHLYLVMELAEGRSLAELVKSETALEWSDAVSIFMQICEALKHAHEKGIYHRDLKPSNVMLVDCEDGESIVKVVDFGIAKIVDEDKDVTQAGTGLGSPLYMSPEQAGGGKIDAGSDIYSMGCLMYEVLTGSPPFRGATSVETIFKHMNEIAQSLSERSGKDFSDEQEELIARCLAKSAAERFADFSQLHAALSAAIEDQSEPESENKAVTESIVLPVSETKTLPDSASDTKPKWIAVMVSCLAVLLCYFSFNLMFDGPLQAPLKPSLKPPSNAGLGDSGSVLSPLPSSQVTEKLFEVKKSKDGLSVKGDFMGVKDRNLKLLLNHPLLKNCDALAGLSLQECAITGATMGDLGRLSIAGLDVCGCPITEAGLAEIAKVKGLMFLYLENSNKISNNALAVLAESPSLTGGIFGGADLTEDAIVSLAANKKFQYIELSGMPISELGARNFMRCPALTCIAFKKCTIAGAALDVLADAHLVTNYKFDRMPLSESLMAKIAALPAQEIIFSHCDLDKSSLALLAASPTMKRLKFLECPSLTQADLVVLNNKKGISVEFTEFKENKSSLGSIDTRLVPLEDFADLSDKLAVP